MKEENQHQVPYTIRKFAFLIAKSLKYDFRDNLKVEYHPGMVYKYCEWSLLMGYKEKDIRKAFLYALEKRHVDATDVSLNKQEPNFKFELSSTVSLARELLQFWEKQGKIEKWNSKMKSNDSDREVPKCRM